METWSVKRILEWGIDFFTKKDIPRARLSAELLLAAALGLTRMDLYLDYDRILNREELGTYKKYILKRLEYIPIQYILGEAYFRNIRLYIDGNVLIPRPETELLVEKALEESLRLLDKKGHINIIEIGTGSGAIILSLYTELLQRSPGSINKIKIAATDISERALEIADRNAESILAGDMGKNLEFIHCDILPEDDSEWTVNNKGKIDLVISNPPYISESGFLDLPREIREYEPKEALVAGETGLEMYEKILSRIKRLMIPGSSCILFETDPIVGGRLVPLVKKYIKVKNISLMNDYNQKERILVAHV
ncbi:MAG: peptide chain release factor N(5)-glutamine methyltransferase [Actinomycetia bacterium]|nr:peptide chain release factor N(5)-glutamine methyltransferase [Actinomycetes bacterium]